MSTQRLAIWIFALVLADGTDIEDELEAHVDDNDAAIRFCTCGTVQ